MRKADTRKAYVIKAIIESTDPCPFLQLFKQKFFAIIMLLFGIF